MEQPGLKDERAAHVAGSDGPCEPPRKTGQSSFQRDMRENSSSQETKEQNESPAAPSRSPDLPKMRDGACDPSPDLLLHSLRFSLSLHSSARSLPLGRHPCRWRPAFRLDGPVGGAGRRLVAAAGVPHLPSGVHLLPPARKPALAEGLGRRLTADFLTSWIPCEAARVPPLPLRRSPAGGRRLRRPHPRLWRKEAGLLELVSLFE